MEINDLCEKAFANAREKGFCESEENIAMKIAFKKPLTKEEMVQVITAFECQELLLIVSELAEAMEALRIGDREKLKEEIADVFIRLGTFCIQYGIDAEKHIQKKMEINTTRPKLHGKLF